MKKHLLPFLLLLLTLSGCTEKVQSRDYELYVFGTLVGITLWGNDTAQQERAVAAIGADFQRMHDEWHAWKPGPLVDINRAIAAGESAKVLPSIVPLITQSSELYRLSDGLFNPAIGALLNLWGFQGDGRPSGPPPASDAIAKWVAANPGMNDLSLTGDMLASRNRAVQLDFGAFAKGYAVDLAIARLREFGIDNAIINAGGDLRAIGSKDGVPWRVGIRHPQGEGVLAALEVSGDESVFTSGNYERYREHEGVHYNHILDPRTGMPVNGVTSVTVIHDNGAVADAATTEWERIARQMGIKYVMLVDEAGVIYMNPAMQRRVTFQAPVGEIRLSAEL